MNLFVEDQGSRSKPRAMNPAAIKDTYRNYAGWYDLLFGATLEPGRRAAVAAVNVGPGQRILEVGVGTGLSLTAYRKDSRIVGIDLCNEMLDKARKRVSRLGLAHVHALLVMDGERMAFADHSFDVVMGMYVVGVTPSPARLMAEMRRVCAPGGDIVVVNHFASRHHLVRPLEEAIAPLSARIGFRPNLELESVTELVGMEPSEVRNINLFGLATLIRFRN